MAGGFGVFFAGQLEARFYDRGGTRLGALAVQPVMPTELVTLERIGELPTLPASALGL